MATDPGFARAVETQAFPMVSALRSAWIAAFLAGCALGHEARAEHTLRLAPEGRVCFHYTFSSVGDAGMIVGDEAVMGAIDGFRQRFENRGLDEVGPPNGRTPRILLGDQPSCDTAQGDLIVNMALKVDRDTERYTLRVDARGKEAERTDMLTRGHALRRPPRVVFPDDPGPTFDSAGFKFQQVIRLDALTMGARLADRVSIAHASP